MLISINYIWTTLVSTLPAMKAFVIATSCFLIFERLIPAEKNHPIKHYMFNFQYTIFYILISPFIVFIPTIIATSVANITNGSLIIIDLNKIHINSVLKNIIFPFLPILIFDFFYYWHHRLQHKIPLLWLQHKLHHTEESLCCMTNLRHHWLEDGIRVFTISIPMALIISLTPVQCTWEAIIISQWSMFFHANLRLPFGPFTAFLSGPQLHRIHHSREERHYNKNFAAFFPIWDIIFGTYYKPKSGEWPATGIVNHKPITKIWGASILPFQEGYELLKNKINQKKVHG